MDATALTANNTHPTPVMPPPGSLPRIGFEVSPTGGPGIFMTRLKAVLETWGCFDAEQPQVWIQLCYDPPLPHDHPGAQAKRLVRTDGIYAIRHQLCPPVSLPWLDTWQSQRKNACRNAPITQNLSQAHGIVYQSAFSRRVVQRFIRPVPPDSIPTFTIFNGIDTTEFTPNPNRTALPDTLQVVISHAFRPHKRLHEAIRLLVALKDAWPQRQLTLHVVGSDDGQSFAPAQALIARHDLGPNVVFHGKLPYNDLYQVYRQCDFALGLAFWDFCPNVIIEMLSCGLPVLGVDWGGIPELVADAGVLIPERITLDYLDLYNTARLPQIDISAYLAGAQHLCDHLADYQRRARVRALAALDIHTAATQYVMAAQTLLSVS
jgi:glycosyltransferase involved in cell wall biosynthesis